MSIENHVPDGTFVEAVANLVTIRPELLTLPNGKRILTNAGEQNGVYGIGTMPEPQAIFVSTLTGIVDAYNADIHDGAKVIVHIAGHDDIRIVTPVVGDSKQCFIYAHAMIDGSNFEYGKFLDLDLFILNMQTNFENTDERKRALDYVGALTAGLAKDIVDDGTTQQVTVRQGVTRAGNTAFINPVYLAPFRTFNEIVQPTSPFVLRTQQKNVSEGNLAATAALFEADGGAWKAEAIQRIGAFLREKLPDAVILA